MGGACRLPSLASGCKNLVTSSLRGFVSSPDRRSQNRARVVQSALVWSIGAGDVIAGRLLRSSFHHQSELVMGIEYVSGLGADHAHQPGPQFAQKSLGLIGGVTLRQYGSQVFDQVVVDEGREKVNQATLGVWPGELSKCGTALVAGQLGQSVDCCGLRRAAHLHNLSQELLSLHL